METIPELIARLDARIAHIETSMEKVTETTDALNDQWNRFFILAAIGFALLHFYLK